MRYVAVMLLMLPATAAAAPAGKLVQSWGKAAVPLERYRLDAAECSLKGGTADVRDEPETERYVQGQRVLDREANQPVTVARQDDTIVLAERQVLLRRMYAPERQVDALQAKMGNWVEACLTERGYTRFALTRGQARTLDRMKLGSPERRRFLHRLASDPAVLAAQAS